MPFKRPDSKYWYIRVDGVPKSSRTEDFDAAKALEDKLSSEAWQQQKMGMPKPRTWAEAVVKWTQEKAAKVTLAEDIKKLRWWHPYLGDVTDLNTITRDVVDEIVQKHRKVRPDMACAENSTANRYVSVVSGILLAAEREWGWKNHAPKLRKYPEPEAPDDSWYEVEEWQKLEAELPSAMKLAATFALATGLREAKVFGLAWEQVSMQNRTLKTQGTKNKRGVYIPLNETAMKVLETCRAAAVRHPVYVFLYEGRPMKEHGQHAWVKAHKRAGIRYRKWHSLRHTFNSWLAQQGCPVEFRKRLCGWVQKGEVVDRYTHLNVEHLRPWSALIDALLAGSEKVVVPDNLSFVTGNRMISSNRL